jgi:lipopolysaccharide export system protein LptA
MPTAFSTALRNLSLVLLIALPGHALAQGPSLAFGSSDNSEAPVEVEAESLSVNQKDGTAEFTGNVRIVQGEMRLNAPRVLVEYTEDQSGVERLEATGGVTIVSGEDAAESDVADYLVQEGVIVMTGNVTIVQGPNTLSSNKVTIDLDAGTAQMEGRVRTILQSGGSDE